MCNVLNVDDTSNQEAVLHLVNNAHSANYFANMC